MPALRLALLTAAAWLLLTAPAPAIVGGDETTDPWPWMAGMEYRESASKPFGFICGGSLVAQDVVLTAAHCVDAGDGANGRPDTEPAANFRFLVGTTNRESGGERIPAVQVVEHPLWDESGNAAGDVALFKLARPAGAPAAPIALAGPADAGALEPATARRSSVGREEILVPPDAFPSGFLLDTTTTQLKRADVPLRSDDECDVSYAFGFTVPFDREYDAAPARGGPGGLLPGRLGRSAHGPVRRRWRQAGVVSEGLGCAYPTQYGIYADVAESPLRGYVESTTAALSDTDATTTGSTSAAPPTPPEPGRPRRPRPARRRAPRCPPSPRRAPVSSCPRRSARCARRAAAAPSSCGCASSRR
jgi:secreted trypsin-like serine protease